MNKVLQLLAIVIPQLTGLGNAVTILRAAFTRIGGSEDELNAALDANQKDIDRLGNPDGFRHKPTGTPPFPIDPNQAIEADGQHLISQPDFSRIGPKDQVWFHPDPSGEGPCWFVLPIRDMSGSDPKAAGWTVVYPIQE